MKKNAIMAIILFKITYFCTVNLNVGGYSNEA
jgi:hypothetical protein